MLTAFITGFAIGIGFSVGIIPILMLIKLSNNTKQETFNEKLMEEWQERNRLHADEVVILGDISVSLQRMQLK